MPEEGVRVAEPTGMAAPRSDGGRLFKDSNCGSARLDDVGDGASLEPGQESFGSFSTSRGGGGQSNKWLLGTGAGRRTKRVQG